jgi:hypothetical protein
MNTTNHTSPSGEDAANGAIGEREAFEHWITTEGGYDPVDMVTHQDGEVYVLAAVHEAWEAWQGRAALTAEKVAGQEPVGFRTRMPGFGWVPWLTDDQATIQKAIKDAHDHGSEGEALYAAPQQPAQSAALPDPSDIQGWSVTVNVNAQSILTIGHNSLSGIDNIEDFAPVVRNCAEHLISFIGVERAQSAEQDERAAEVELCRHCGEPTDAPGYCVCNGARYEREHRAAHTQSTATQPVQTQVALTDEQRDAVEYAQQVLRQVEAGDGTFVGQCTEAIEGLDALLTAAYPEIGGKS